MGRTDGLALNYYGPCTLRTPLATLTQHTDYPRAGRVEIVIDPASGEPFTLALRIPHWSEQTQLQLNGETIQGIRAGGYWEINRKWEQGDRLVLTFDFRPHFWSRPVEGQVSPTSIYRGPLLLTYDPHHQEADREPLPVLDAARLELREVEDSRWLKPWLLFETTATDGSKLRLCDFASAGVAGTAYESWLPMQNAAVPLPFSRANPLRSQRALA